MKTLKLLPLLIVVFVALGLTSCGSKGNSSSTRCLVVDMSNYPDLDKDAHFMMQFSNPLDSMVRDTIYWTGDKKIRYELNDSLQDFLAFIDVFMIPDNEDEINKFLFRTVVALDGQEPIVRADNRYTVLLSGTPANQQINDLRTEKYKGELPQGMDTMTFIKNYLQHELSMHQNDLCGAYIYSYLAVQRLAEFEETEDMSYWLYAQQIIEEEKQTNTYLSKHNVALPIFESVRLIGDVSSTVVLDFVRYMYPAIDYCFVNPNRHEYTKEEYMEQFRSLRGESRKRLSDQDSSQSLFIYIEVDSLNQISVGRSEDALQLVTIAELDEYFKQNMDSTIKEVKIKAHKNFRMGLLTEIKQTLRDKRALKIVYSALQK